MTPTPRFLCDEMLKGLGRWLRAAGYDTLMLADGEPDRILLRRAHADGRLLITRDRGLLLHAEARGIVVCLVCDGLAECARELSRRLTLDWLYRPFSRCLHCNTLMLEATASQRQQLPADAQGDELVLYCPNCDQLFWQGGHVWRMQAQLQRWAAGEFRTDLSPP